MGIITQLCGIAICVILAVFFKQQRKLYLETQSAFVRLWKIVFAGLILDISSMYILRYEDSEVSMKLLKDLIQYYESNPSDEYDFDEKSLFKAKNILNKYINNLPQINENSSDERIIDLINEINKTISDGKPIFTLDRLHTLVHNKLREICTLHNIEFDKKERMDQLLKNI